ncbi:MAG: Cu2+-exporting ATPase/Cu+-exporting ATPase [Bacteriovoracaceae bacterium]|jgi:heavy metal translocating P-type ATPase
MSHSKLCTHCNEKIIIPVNLDSNSKLSFCCQGCKTVYEILHDHKLETYYQLREQSEKASFTPISTTQQKFLYLDDKEFLEKYAQSTSSTNTITFYLENIHCLACLWLIEKLSDFIPGVLNSKLNMSKSTVEITARIGTNFSIIAKQLEALGYPPHPIMEDSELKKLQQKEDHKDLIRIAVAFFCTGNIMLLAFSVYAGADGAIRMYFDWLSFFLYLPIFFYAAIPFYKSAWTSIKNKTISIDFPIVLALILGGIFSFHSVYFSLEHIYFDSLTMLVFLLLTSRYILKKSQQKGLASSEISSFFTNIISYKIEKHGKIKEVYSKFLKINDKIIIYPGDTVPVDAVITKGTTNINNSLLTGEIIPLKVTVGEEILSGTINIEQEIEALVIQTASDSKLGQILQAVEKGWNQKTNIITFTDKIAKYFVSTVFIISIIVLIYFISQGRYEDAIIRSLTLIIITCPCALGLTTPLSLTLALAKLAKKGIIVKDELVIEKTNELENIIFDKTGTLTYGKFKVVEWINHHKEPHYNIVYELEKKSSHPIAKSIISFILSQLQNEPEKLNVFEFEEILGVGPKGIIENSLFEIKAFKGGKRSSTHIGLYKDNELINEVILDDTIKDGAIEELRKIELLGLKTFILSGDNNFVVGEVGKTLGIKNENIFSEKNPNEKLEIIQSIPNSMMLGDGANDAIALSFSNVGVAMHGSVDISLRASSVFMANNDLKNISKLIIISKETIKLIKRNLIFSLSYNVLGCLLAVQGLISPLTAAILMPLSSFTVLISTILGTKKLRNQSK